MNRNGRGEPWLKQEISLLRRMYPTWPLADIARAIGRTKPAVKSRAKLLGLKRKYVRKIWTAKEDRELRRLYPNTPTSELAKRFSCSAMKVYQRAARTGTKKSPEFVEQVLRALGTKLRDSGKGHRFPKGNVPLNKGLRRPGWFAGRMRETQFKKGARVPGQRQIGDQRLVDGYLYTKISEIPRVPWTRNWRQTHYIIWEKVNGPIPPGHKLCFKDGDKTHVVLDNLELLTCAEVMRRNTIHNRLPPDLKQVVFLAGALKRQIRRRDGKKQDVRSKGPSVRNAGVAEGHRQAVGR